MDMLKSLVCVLPMVLFACAAPVDAHEPIDPDTVAQPQGATSNAVLDRAADNTFTITIGDPGSEPRTCDTTGRLWSNMPANTTALVLRLWQTSSIVARTYAVNAPLASARAYHMTSDCAVRLDAEAISGQIDVTSVDATQISGTYGVTMDDGTQRVGNFIAPLCATRNATPACM